MRILIVDGSAVYRRMYLTAADGVDKEASLDFAPDGDAAREKIKSHDYDIIVVDAEIPGAGLNELLKSMVKTIPKALLVIAARPSVAGSKLVGEALANGAAICMTKPINENYDSNVESIKQKMAEWYEIFLSKHAKKPREPVAARRNEPVSWAGGGFVPKIVLIAASTGGPAALETVLSGLDEDLPAPIIIVQHMPPSFLEPLALQLAKKTRLLVKVAGNMETIVPGKIYLVPGGVHAKLDKQKRIFFDYSPPVKGLRPAADVLFKSAAESLPKSAKVLAVILTGMGCDGEEGLVMLKQKLVCFCIAQSEKTCVVYGMPRAVIERRLADAVLDLDDIAPRIMRMMKSETEVNV